MKKYSVGCIFASLLLVFSIFTLFSIVEVNAEKGMSVNADGYENTIIVEFENDSESKIKTVRVWPGGEITFESFKSEPGWGGGKYSEGKMIIFTATNTLNPGESVKFGLVTSEKIDGINWKVLDQNNNDIDSGKIKIQLISQTDPDFIEEGSKEVKEAKDTGGDLYGTKKFIPEAIRIGSDVRIVGNGFIPEQNLKFYLDNIILKVIKTDEQGNFLSTISIPDDTNAGKAEFVIMDEDENTQSTTINIEEQKNRFLKTAKFQVNDIPAEVSYDEILNISGSAYPTSAVILEFEDTNRILEKVRVVEVNANGEWNYEEPIGRDELLGERYVIIQNNKDKTTKNLTIKSDYLVQVSHSTVRYNVEDTLSLNGIGSPSEKTTLWIKDEEQNIMHYDVFTTQPNGDINYEFVINESFDIGTYVVIVKQDNGADASLFGVGKYPTVNIVTLMEKTNFTVDSKAVLNIIGPPSSRISIQVLDSSDNIKKTDSITTSSTGKSRYVIDLEGLNADIYRAVVSSTHIQDSTKFSVGLESGSGPISLISTKDNYMPGQSIIVLGNTGNNARITITLYDPNGTVSTIAETFSDSSGNFSTHEIGVPIDGELGVWKLTAHSRLDAKSVNINVSLPAQAGVTLSTESGEFGIGDVVTISGQARTSSTTMIVEITNADGESLVTLSTPISGDGGFSLPWTVPSGTPTGTYTITVNDAANSDSVEIFIQ